MYGVYNVDTLEKLIHMVHKMNNRSVWYEKLYAGHVNKWFEMYSASQGANYYAIHSLLYLRTIQEKYIKMYERFVNQLKEYSRAIRILSKGYLPISLAMIRGVKAISKEIETIDKEYWIIKIGLSFILLCILFLTIEKLYRMPMFRKYHYSNTIKIMIFISDIKSYVPIKLCKTSGSIHLFKLTGSINKENITLHKNMLWDVMEIDWQLVTVTLSGNVINLPGSVIIPFRDKFKIRQIIKSRPLFYI